ncbi:MAG: DNA methyltransferase [Chloroflexota bacterium]
MQPNSLYYGDNLDILRQHIPDESVDLIYLDPPFNSSRDYNVLFADESGNESEAQITAFKDTWHWTSTAEDTYYDLVTDAPAHVTTAIEAMMTLIGRNQMMAYLVMMTARLVELHRVLKPTGSLYLHCDPTASHYLKIVLDAIFDVKNFRNEIIWRRTGSHNTSRSYGSIHDVILFYTKTSNYTFNVVKRPYMLGHVEDRYKYDEVKDKYKFTSGGNILTGPGATNGESGQEWRGFNPSAKNRHWAVPGFLAEQMPPEFEELGVLAKLEALYQVDLIEIEEGRAWPTPVRYLNEDDGQPLQDIWAYQPYTDGTVYGTEDGIDKDIAWLGTTDPERLGYPTQKPVALVERIISASSNEGDVVLDPFCGCGTAISAAQRLNRKWVGIDITHLSISLQKFRLRNEFDLDPATDYTIVGEPTTVEGARALATDSDNDGRYQFQFWALSLVQAKPLGGQVGSRTGRRGADKGIDGIVNFFDMKPSQRKPRAKKVVVQVKSGKVGSKDIRDLVGTVKREKAALGVFLTLESPTKDMTKEAVSAGYYESPMWNEKYPKIQILTVEDLLDGKHIEMPPQSLIAFKHAQRVQENKQTKRLL